jgi:hypothetical protein
MKQNTQNGTYITIRTHNFTKLNRNMPNIKPYIKLYKIEPKEYERM